MKRISLHAGVSRGSGGWLRSPAVDARDLAAAAAACGFGVQRVLIDCSAAELVAELRVAVAEIRRGDALLLTFSGHGRESSWCCADRDLPLRDVCEVLALLPSRALVLVVADACHHEAWRAIDVRLRAEVTVIAPRETYARDGHGKNTRSPFTAAVIRAMLGDPPAVRPCAGKAAHRRR